MRERAVGGGAKILMAPTDHDDGSRDFVATDRQRSVWCFGTSQPAS
jgi:uncharacterized glyoxalase superfamily protein PhnB